MTGIFFHVADLSSTDDEGTPRNQGYIGPFASIEDGEASLRSWIATGLPGWTADTRAHPITTHPPAPGGLLRLLGAYRPGDRVIHHKAPARPPLVLGRGTVQAVNDDGTVLVCWDHGPLHAVTVLGANREIRHLTHGEEDEEMAGLYSPGRRVRLLWHSDPHSDLKPGQRGTLQHLDDAGTAHINWDNGSTLGMCVSDGTDAIRGLLDHEIHAEAEARQANT